MNSGLFSHPFKKIRADLIATGVFLQALIIIRLVLKAHLLKSLLLLNVVFVVVVRNLVKLHHTLE